MTTNNDRTADIEAAFRAWLDARERLRIAQSHLSEARANGWHQHELEYMNRVNAGIEQEAECYRRVLQARG